MSIADQTISHTKSLIASLVLTFGVVFFMQVDSAYAQTIKITVLDGSNGHAMTNKCVYVWVGNKSDPMSGPLLQTQTSSYGVLNLTLVQGQEVTNGEVQLACGLSGVAAPSMKFGDTISIRTGYALCQSGVHDSWLARANFSTEEVLQHGVVTPNSCGKATALSRPGEVVLFVRPLTLWEKLKK
jgi:hypothetical protein